MGSTELETSPAPVAATIRRRRLLLGSVIAVAMAALARLFERLGRRRANAMWLRPPGARPEPEFADACTRCFKCGNACPNDCIRFHDAAAGAKLAFTPYIDARRRACILCGECATVCPSGALTPFKADADGWLAGVRMGVARVNKSMCFSYHGRTCGACYQACPLAGTAIKIGIFETPLMQKDHCVGCGLCEQACLHLPQAIRVIPARMIEPQDA
ncbi:MAG: 4Fe-4S dicluster domain-containing protein [Myxococcales bacterium]|nr:4Fe-4S dicluster domain-containing protein [Myxococcales bacterium]